MAAIRGLSKFVKWFQNHQDKYVLIGGCAANTIMEEEGLEFRATKDLDVVLVIEAVNPAFAKEFWAFIEAGGYLERFRGSDTRPNFYRFEKPADESFPFMIELFARAPDLLAPLKGEGNLTPIPIEEEVSSLSAILLDDATYQFLLGGRIIIDGLSLINEERLIPLKAQAWMELTDRRDAGDKIDSRKVSKHLKDVVKLSEILRGNQTVALPVSLQAVMDQFNERARALPDSELGAFGGRAPYEEALARVASVFGMDDPAAA